MTETTRTFLVLGALAMAGAVALGAFGAHALKARVGPADLDIWQTAVHYHVAHALGLLIVAGVAQWLPDAGRVGWAGALMSAGIVIFSGSLYVLVLTGARWLGAVTPVGGTAFIAAWVWFAWTVWRA